MVHMILLAAGGSRRFGENKLLCSFNGKPLYMHVFDMLFTLQEENKYDLHVVTQYEEIEQECEIRGISVVHNSRSIEGITTSICCGIEDVKEYGPEDYYFFFVADQPHLQLDTIQEFLKAFFESHKSMGCLSDENRLGNPAIFHVKYREELLALHGDVGGKQLFFAHPDEVFSYEVGKKIELVDYDERW